MKLKTEIYKSTSEFPKSELYGLVQQIRRTAVSMPSNIAEGKGHRSEKEFVHFLLYQEDRSLKYRRNCKSRNSWDIFAKGLEQNYLQPQTPSDEL